MELGIRDSKILEESWVWSSSLEICFLLSAITQGASGNDKRDVQGVELQHVRMGIRGSNDRRRFARALSWSHRSIAPER